MTAKPSWEGNLPLAESIYCVVACLHYSQGYSLGVGLQTLWVVSVSAGCRLGVGLQTLRVVLVRSASTAGKQSLTKRTCQARMSMRLLNIRSVIGPPADSLWTWASKGSLNVTIDVAWSYCMPAVFQI